MKAIAWTGLHWCVDDFHFLCYLPALLKMRFRMKETSEDGCPIGWAAQEKAQLSSGSHHFMIMKCRYLIP